MLLAGVFGPEVFAIPHGALLAPSLPQCSHRHLRAAIEGSRELQPTCLLCWTGRESNPIEIANTRDDSCTPQGTPERSWRRQASRKYHQHSHRCPLAEEGHLASIATSLVLSAIQAGQLRTTRLVHARPLRAQRRKLFLLVDVFFGLGNWILAPWTEVVGPLMRALGRGRRRRRERNRRDSPGIEWPRPRYSGILPHR